MGTIWLALAIVGRSIAVVLFFWTLFGMVWFSKSYFSMDHWLFSAALLVCFGGLLGIAAWPETGLKLSQQRRLYGITLAALLIVGLAVHNFPEAVEISPVLVGAAAIAWFALWARLYGNEG